MTEITREMENEAFEKLGRKFDKLAPWARAKEDEVMMPKLTVLDVKAMLQMYRRHCS